MAEPRVEAGHKICCLLHSLGPGGATWQSIRLLADHVERGGGATIFSQPGSLVEVAQGAGIEVCPVTWAEDGGVGGIWSTLGEYDLAIVQWELGPVELFARVLEECGRAALAMHSSPQGVSRSFAPPAPMKLGRAVELAVTDPRAVTLVCGAAHRRKVAAAYGVPAQALRVLPPSVPLAELSFAPTVGKPKEMLAMTRLAPEKMSIIRLAVELLRGRLAGGNACRLTIAGDGPRRAEAIELCELSLPPGSWRIEGAPADPITRLTESDLVVAQGTTTLEAAALGRRAVVARSLGAHEASGAVLTPENYDEAGRDPFGDPRATEDVSTLWDEVLALDEGVLAMLRQQVEKHNSPEAASRALAEALVVT
jgi:hypothetical protein